MTRNYLTYLDDLELRHPLHTPAYGIPGISQNASVFRSRNSTLGLGLGLAQQHSISTSNMSQQQQNGSNIKEKSGIASKLPNTTQSSTASLTGKTAWELEEDDNPAFELYPRKFRCSGRIGRGGRLILDRKPVCILNN